MLKHYESKFPSLYLTAHFTLWLKKIQRARHTPWPLSSAWEIPFQCMIDQLIPSWVTSSHSRKAPTRCGQPLTLHLFHVWVSLKKKSTFVNRNLLNQDKLKKWLLWSWVQKQYAEINQHMKFQIYLEHIFIALLQLHCHYVLQLYRVA